MVQIIRYCGDHIFSASEIFDLVPEFLISGRYVSNISCSWASRLSTMGGLTAWDVNSFSLILPSSVQKVPFHVPHADP